MRMLRALAQFDPKHPLHILHCTTQSTVTWWQRQRDYTGGGWKYILKNSVTNLRERGGGRTDKNSIVLFNMQSL
jgi:hypothetical protein